MAPRTVRKDQPRAPMWKMEAMGKGQHKTALPIALLSVRRFITRCEVLLRLGSGSDQRSGQHERLAELKV
jgi:hypothetical protein